MRSVPAFLVSIAMTGAILLSWTVPSGGQASSGNWPYWRGPAADGMAVGDAPVQWSDTENVRWRADIPGHGNSSPVVWGDRIFLTTAIPVGDPIPEQVPAAERPGGRGNQAGGGSGPLVEHRFDVLCLERTTGRILWQKTASTAVPHEGYHRTYGSFASNSPVTDGERV